jgi:hypothetical protein
MNTCLELFNDLYRLDFYRAEGVTGDGPAVLIRRAVDKSLVSVDESSRLFSVGRYSSHDDSHIRANDTHSSVTTKVSESKEDKYYEVTVHFEFQNPTLNLLNLIDVLQYTPTVVMVRFLGPDGQPASSRLIRPAGEVAQTLAVTEDSGVTSVDFTVYAVNGIQALL